MIVIMVVGIWVAASIISIIYYGELFNSPLSCLCGFHTDFLGILIYRRIIFNDTRDWN